MLSTRPCEVLTRGVWVSPGHNAIHNISIPRDRRFGGDFGVILCPRGGLLLIAKPHDNEAKAMRGGGNHGEPLF